jgi:hypothetical protein
MSSSNTQSMEETISALESAEEYAEHCCDDLVKVHVGHIHAALRFLRASSEPSDEDWKRRALDAEAILRHNMALANATTRRAQAERNAIIRTMREKYSAIEIANMAGLTRQRVHQILNEAPVESSSPPPGACCQSTLQMAADMGQENLRVMDERDQMRTALVHAVSVIQTWHNMSIPKAQRSELWDTYWKSAPEMVAIRNALTKSESL